MPPSLPSLPDYTLFVIAAYVCAAAIAGTITFISWWKYRNSHKQLNQTD